MAGDRRRQPDRRLRHTSGWNESHRPARTPPGPPRPKDSVHPGGNRKTPDLYAGPRPRILRRPHRPRHRPRRRRQRLPLVIPDRRHSKKSPIPDESLWRTHSCVPRRDSSRRPFPCRAIKMYLTKKSISRRTLLRAAGTAVALPLLDAMIPALAPAATTTPVRRLGVVYHPNGVIYEQWVPTGEGTQYELSKTLKGLEPFKDKTTVITGLFCDAAEANGDGGGDHSRACGSYLTGI